jgi:hypothetical protein
MRTDADTMRIGCRSNADIRKKCGHMQIDADRCVFNNVMKQQATQQHNTTAAKQAKTWFCPGNPSWFCRANLIPIPIWTECCAINGHAKLTRAAHAPPIHQRLAHAATHFRALHPPLPQTQKARATMATPWTITPSSVTPPTEGRWPSNLFQSLPHVDTHQPMCRQLQSHSRFHVRHRRPSRTHEFTISTSHDLVQFAVKPFHLWFERNHFPRFQIIMGSVCYVLVSNRWVLFTQA